MTLARFVKRKEFFAGVLLLAMTFSNLVSAGKLVGFLRNGYQDFTIFYAAARMVRSGQSHVLYSLSDQYHAQQEFAPNVPIRRAALPYNHPPFEALLFLPFTLLSYGHAYLLWSMLNGMMVAASLALLRKQFVEVGSQPLPFLVLAATGFLPVASAIIQGQDSILLLFLFVVALTALETGNDVGAGVALAAGLFKFHLVLPLVFLLAGKRPRLLFGFAPAAALLGGISLAMVGWHGAAGYVQFLMRLENTGAGGAIVGADMPNLRGIIASLAGSYGGTALVPLTIACSAAVVLIAWWQMRPARHSVRFAFLLATATTILVSYHTLTYDLSLLLPLALLLFATPASVSSDRSQADIVLFALLYLLPWFDPFWPKVNQFCWPVVVLTWLFWKLGSGRAAESVARS